MTEWRRDPGSFRDPSGFVFYEDGVLYRQVNEIFAPHYDRLMSSGLYGELASDGLLVEHEEVPSRPCGAPPAHVVVRPKPLPFISYPYEWCFGQLKAAALATLDLQKRAMRRGMTLRDASAYNIQFVGSRPLLIDTLSLGLLADGEPWAAYRQFCEHFVAPLALMALRDPSLGQLLRVFVDGIPLELAARLLPEATRLRLGLLVHVHLHARSIGRFSALPVGTKGVRLPGKRMSRSALSGLIDSLETTVRGLVCRHRATEWESYYTDTNYSALAHQRKQELVSRLIDTAVRRRPASVVWDLGANVGTYSRIAANFSATVVSLDKDHAAVQRNYRECVSHGETRVLPLIQDLLNPSAGVGWTNSERRSLAERGPADVVLALALVHHLALSGNVPLGEIARFLRAISRQVVIEFVPKSDSQVQRMLGFRRDVFDEYGEAAFEAEFERAFRVVSHELIEDSERSLYLMEAR